MIDLEINRVLAHPLITRSKANNARGTYWVQIGTLKTEILIMLTPSAEKPGWFDFRISHTIKTPLQAVPYHPINRSGSSRANALHIALRTILHQYRTAINNGLTPGEDWLVWQL